MPRRGGRLGKYRLDRKLGEGAFATVWKARDLVEGRDVALKVALPSVVEEYGREEIEREARLAVKLSHPNIVAVRNADWIDGYFVLATELGRTTLERHRGARRSARIALRIIRDIAAGLAHAHARRILHRDVKPENIVIFDDGRAALTDFGLSRFSKGMTQDFTKVGTFGYLAPEQAYGRTSFASDVFSLGLIAYEILTGVLPSWPFEWPPEGIERFEAKVPEPVRPVLRRAAELEPERRFASAVELEEKLEAAFRRVEERPHRRTPRRRPAPEPSPLAVQAELFRRRYGRRLGMRYACHRCEGPIAEEMVFCPWCGSADNSFRQLSPYPLVCPDCERGVRPEWTACPWCFSGRFQGNGRPLRPDARAERRCSRKGCPGQLRPFMRYCPVCKQKVRRPWSDPELPDRCPRCRWPVSRSFWRFCPWCGRKEREAGSFHLQRVQ
ncbi:MAG: serine/threonine-protein kinase [Myxococcota bacterium]